METQALVPAAQIAAGLSNRTTAQNVKRLATDADYRREVSARLLEIATALDAWRPDEPAPVAPNEPDVVETPGT